MILAVHQPQYLPWLGYFDKIIKSDCFVFLDRVQYKGREFQNRNKIRTKNGWIWLSVPVISKGLGRQKVAEVKIDNKTNWQNKHWHSLKTWYGKAKFFERYLLFFEGVYRKKWERLADLNVYLIKHILEDLKIERKIYFESELGVKTHKTERVIEIAKKIGADTYLSGVGGRNYLREERFREEGVKLQYQYFIHPRYRQLFAREQDSFVPFMGIVDLLFNEGPKSRKILDSQAKMY